MLVKDSGKAENVKFKRMFSGAVSKLIAEKIVMPFLLIMIFGAGATAAYAFISHFANADNHEEMTVHGYAAVATTINKYASLPGYAILSMLLWAIKWVLNMKFSVKKLKFAERCGKQLYSFENGGSLTDSFVKKTAVAVYACTAIMFLLLLIVGFILLGIHLIIKFEMKVLSLQSPLKLETMYGLAEMLLFFLVLQ